MGEVFIGRRKYLEELGEDFFVTDADREGMCCSLVGPNDIGKTMLVKRLAEEFEKKDVKNVYYFDLKIIAVPQNFFWVFWTDVVMRMADVITREKMEEAPCYSERSVEEVLKAYAFFSDEEELNKMGTNGFDVKARIRLEKIFRFYTKLGIHVILTIDEFDLARVAVPEESGDGSFFQWLFSLSPKGSSKLKLSIMLISRRRVGTIAHHMTGGSSIESAYPQKSLCGFSDEELEEYFRTYADLECGLLTEQEKRDVLYFCGRHPGLLMHMRKAVSRTGRDGDLDIEEIFVGQAPMKAVYDRMVELMRTEYVDSARTKNCLSPFVQAFIGPPYEERLNDYIITMYNLGFLTRVESGTRDIFELAGEEQKRVWEYEPLSLCFVRYFEDCVLPDMKGNACALLNHTEVMVRTMILEVFKEKFPDSYEAELKKFGAPWKSASLKNLKKGMQKNVLVSEYTMLNVMAFNDYAEIIGTHWDDMQAHLRSFPDSSLLTEEFAFLTDTRNFYAHNNSECLREEDVSRLEKLCKRLCADIEAIPVRRKETGAGREAAAACEEAPSESREERKALESQEDREERKAPESREERKAPESQESREERKAPESQESREERKAPEGQEDREERKAPESREEAGGELISGCGGTVLQEGVVEAGGTYSFRVTKKRGNLRGELAVPASISKKYAEEVRGASSSDVIEVRVMRWDRNAQCYNVQPWTGPCGGEAVAEEGSVYGFRVIRKGPNGNLKGELIIPASIPKKYAGELKGAGVSDVIEVGVTRWDRNAQCYIVQPWTEFCGEEIEED